MYCNNVYIYISIYMYKTIKYNIRILIYIDKYCKKIYIITKSSNIIQDHYIVARSGPVPSQDFKNVVFLGTVAVCPFWDPGSTALLEGSAARRWFQPFFNSSELIRNICSLFFLEDHHFSLSNCCTSLCLVHMLGDTTMGQLHITPDSQVEWLHRPQNPWPER